MIIKRTALAAGVLAASGCASLDMSRSETAWQTLHAVDVAQTLNAARDPCYRESDPLTRAIIGEQPSTGEVVAWAVGSSVLHAVVSRKLERHAPKWVTGVWHSLSIGSKGLTIGRNHAEGIRPFGDNVQQAGSLVDPDRYPGCEWQ